MKCAVTLSFPDGAGDSRKRRVVSCHRGFVLGVRGRKSYRYSNCGGFGYRDAIGAAIQGKRPVLELAYMDFAMLAMDMIVNQAAKHSFLSGGKTKVPFVIRTAIGTGNGLSMQHSQSLEAFFYHVPGLKIVVPSSPGDAKGLLISAIRDDSPVIFIEHKLLYSVSGEVSEDDTPVPFGKAAIRHNGNDCTIVSYSRMVSVVPKRPKSLKRKASDVKRSI